MRARLVFVVVAMVGGTVGAAAGPFGGNVPVSATLDVTDAFVEGDLTMEITSGALRVRGVPRMSVLNASTVEARLVTTERENVHDPVTGGFYVKRSHHEDVFVLDALDALEIGPIQGGRVPILHAAADGAEGTGLRAVLGPGAARPFRPSAEPLRFVAGLQGQQDAYEHVVPAPILGVQSDASEGPFEAGLQHVVVRGPMTLVIDHAVVTLSHATGTRALLTGERETDAHDVGPIRLHTSTTRSYLVLRLPDDAAILVDVGGTDTVLAAREARYQLDGRLLVPRASAVLDVDGTPAMAAGEAVEVVGNFTLQAVAHAAASGGFPLQEAPPGTRAVVQGEADRVAVAGRPIGDERARAVERASITAIVAALAAVAWGPIKHALAPLYFVVHARLAGRDLLLQRHRSLLYALIERHPLIHMRELQRRSGLGYGCVAYHLSLLKRERLVGTVRLPRKELYVSRSLALGTEALARIAELAHPTRSRVAHAVVHRGPVTQADLMALSGLSQSALSKHLSRLARAGLVEAARGAVILYSAAPALRDWVLADASDPRPVARVEPAPAGAA